MFEEYQDLLTLEDLCDALSIGKNQAYQIVASGELRCMRTGRAWKIPKVALIDYVLKKSGIK
jgi:excisionase family DNA binding protein